MVLETAKRAFYFMPVLFSNTEEVFFYCFANNSLSLTFRCLLFQKLGTHAPLDAQQ
jgi:hypothetical protein